MTAAARIEPTGSQTGKAGPGFPPPPDRKEIPPRAGDYTAMLRRWAEQSQACGEKEREAGWAARILLHETGRAQEPVHVFRQAYLEAVLEEQSLLVLHVLKDLNPADFNFRETVRQAWERRLRDARPAVVSVAKEALFRLAVPQATAAGRKYIRRADIFVAFELCREGQQFRQTERATGDRFGTGVVQRARALLALPPATAAREDRPPETPSPEARWRAGAGLGR